MGADRTTIVFLWGNSIARVETRHRLDAMETAGRVEQIIRQDNPARVNIGRLQSGGTTAVENNASTEDRSRRIEQMRRREPALT
jgi:hypothetical protein